MEFYKINRKLKSLIPSKVKKLIKNIIAVKQNGEASNAENKSLPGKRTLLVMQLEQDPFNNKKIHVLLEVYEDLELTSLWIKYNDKWIEAGFFTASGQEPSREGNKLYSIDIDVSMLAELLPKDSADEIEIIQEGRGQFFIQAASGARRIPKIAEEVREIDGRFIFRYPLGIARLTELSQLQKVETSVGCITPYVNPEGHLKFIVNGDLKPYASITNTGIGVNDCDFYAHGSIAARHTQIESANLLIVGRVSGYTAKVDAQLQLIKNKTQDTYGLLFYSYDAVYNLDQDLSEITDDVADLYLEFKILGSDELLRKRIGKSSPSVRNNTKPAVVKYKDKALSIIPYYTHLANNPSLQLECFSREIFDYLQLALEAENAAVNKKPVWVIGEVPYKAQENGMLLFRYMRDHHREIDCYYIIDPKSAEINNLKGYDNVLAYRSKDHIDVILRADKVIGTHQPFQLYPTRDKKLADKVKERADHIFLQHGITAAKWMTSYAGKGVPDFYVNLIMVASDREKEFFVHDFGYEPNEVAVAGFTRFDALFASDVEKNEKQLLIMPTWRAWLQDPETFNKSEYFVRWSELLTSARLKDIANKHGLELVFCLHPNMRQYSKIFRNMGARVVLQGEVSVQELLKQSAALITDYSSVAFDFSFLHKPVVFYQFDSERFKAPHANPFTEFPGPVLALCDEVMDYIDKIFSCDGAMAPEYIAKANRFIKYRDTNNCKRTYEAILNFSREKESLFSELTLNNFLDRTEKRLRKEKLYLPLIRRLYKILRFLPLDENIIVFESDLARRFGDNPKAIYDELVQRGDSRKRVIVSNQPVRVFDDKAVVVKRHSFKFVWYMARAKYFINNNNFPDYIRTRRDAMFFQTWHGTPLKKMFLDQENFYGRDEGYIDRVKKMVAQWSVLITPNAHTTKAMRSSYGFEGTVYELGHSRNDILKDENADNIRRTIRHQYGIHGNKFVVLYAPTFRDDKPTKRGRFAFDLPFEPLEFYKALGDDAVLLIRTHQLVDTKLHIPAEFKKNIIDVSKYPDMQELFLASDMLITDYSSSFFDYAILQRPIVFFAYDLENYRDNLRGFYLDYMKDLPGPIVTNTESLFDKIKFYSNKENNTDLPIDLAFIKRYAPHDDGHVAARIVDNIL